MKHSIRVRLTFLLTILMALTIILTWFINNTFLPEFYQYSKKKTLAEVYDQVQYIYSRSEEEVFLSEDDTLKLERIASNKNVNIYVIMSFAGSTVFNFPEPKNIGEREKLQILARVLNYMQGMSFPKEEITKLQEKDNYVLYRINDRDLDSNYLDLLGRLGNNKVIYIRSNYESIQESSAIANQFLAYIGTISLILGIIAMLVISKKFTRPILELADIAKKMSDLDFEVKYQVNSKDEIGELGSSINILSDKLKDTVLELKKANNELMTDLQKKTEIDEMRKEFLSNVSHELKTPISLIQGYAEGLKENINEDEESRDFYCEVIMDEADKMNKMVKKLLSLNELEFGNSQVNFERFDIIALIRSILDTTEILFRQKDVTLHFEDKKQMYVWADEYLVEQVVTNYISNALNHVGSSGIIEIKLIRHDDVIRVAVFNTGDNIPMDELDKIWIKFYKVDKARTREYGGSGIGLSIVKAIMNSLNRECGVVNHPTGVEFWFELDAKS